MKHNTPLFSYLSRLSAEKSVRFTMPGHKGMLDPMDVTEVGDMPNLHHPTDPLLSSLELAASAYGAAQCRFSVNGASAGILALLLASVSPGERVLLERESHVSAANALVLGGQIPVFLPPKGGGLSPYTTQDYMQAMDEHPDIKALFVTYPNYYGRGCDIAALYRETQKRGVLLLADGAHSALFPFSSQLPPPCVGDGWVISAHKTLPCPNQGAYVFWGKESRMDKESFFFHLSMLQTTSPSWPLLAHLDRGRAWAQREGETAVARLLVQIDAFYRLLKASSVFPVLPASATEAWDPTRVVLNVSSLGGGFLVADTLFSQKDIWVEMADTQHVVLLTTPQNGQEDFRLLYEGFQCFSRQDKQETSSIENAYQYDAAMIPREAACGTIILLPLHEAVGHIAARPVVAYPPGYPILWPGDRITPSQVSVLSRLQRLGGTVLTEDGRISCVRESIG